MPTTLMNGHTLLHGRYTLTEQIADNGTFSVWKARDDFGGPMSLKAWPFQGEKPDNVSRALWDVELRHLFRLASLPGAEDHLVVLKDAAVDKKAGYFVMAFMAPGLTPLDVLLSDRARCPWLSGLRVPAARAELWRGIKGLALGLMQLHTQHILHRAISAESVLVEPVQGPSTMRLGGFEWTARLGSDWTAARSTPLLPSDESTRGYSFESDWFLFGALAARLIASAEPPPHGDATERHQAVLLRVRERDLLEPERELLQRLLTHDADARLAQGNEIVSRINDVLISLDEPARRAENSYLALLALLGPQRSLTQAIIDEDEKISALNLEDQRVFIENDIKNARIIRQQGGAREAYILTGQRLNYYVTEHARDNEMDAATGAWDLAYCGSATELRHSAGSDDQRPVDRLPIKVFTLSAFFKDENVVRRAAVPWKALLPRQNRGAADRERLERFHDFFRVTNQIELLMRDAEIFAYEIRSKQIVDGAEIIILREDNSQRRPLDFAKMFENLGDFLNNQQEEDKPGGNLVYLGIEDALNPTREILPSEYWHFIQADVNGDITLRRPLQPTSQKVPPKGLLRPFALFGQMSLVKRRRRAIDKLKNHAYLLQALQRPDFVQLDSGEIDLPRDIDPAKIDEAKRSAMRNIWRSRPIFALQGPPGTGKTTLVANLLGQIFEDDPVAQVLVTAQAHAAVDVLRDKVSKEVFQTQSELPLSIRLPRKKDDEERDPDYVDQVTAKMLVQAAKELQAEPTRTRIQEEWMKGAEKIASALHRGDLEGHARDLCELVQRAAGITYCTATAGNLENLADTKQTFDWSIIEEAGKAHGFDLVLPLQTGHRWLLIGDQNQLKPYRYENFWTALSKLDVVFATLRELPDRAGGHLDTELVYRWQKYSASEKEERRKLWLQWLGFFARLYETCYQLKAATDTSGPVLAEMLSEQHRMHPTIAELVSRAYYDGKIKSGTIRNGVLEARVVHPFVEPTAIVGRAIVWIDVDWVNKRGRGEQGPKQKTGRYTAPDEVDAAKRFIMALRAPASAQQMKLATLAPYRLQVVELNRALRDVVRPWLLPPEERGRQKKKPPASTVDSFQGDQADVVIVSLVRNNQKVSGTGLGFLREAERMNVLFSRAERLLVLVGSWDFFQHQLDKTPADPTQPLGKWRIALDYLDECFKAGTAVKLSVNSLPRLQ